MFSPHATDIDQHVVDQFDFGIDPPGVLVAREKQWPRAVGVVLCSLLAPAQVYVYPVWIGLKDNAVVFAICWACFGAVLLLIAFWLLWLLMHPTLFYVALDSRNLYIRRGPGEVEAIPIDDIVAFESGNGLLRARLQSRRRPRTILKGMYARDNLKLIATKFNG